ncbi:cell adhesion molecule CEACAM6-like isoform X2 [Macrotis lagotis]|uniref:cell adhesion molecule CEACAM6-like isoform X2 n=1 Tax=Macrotis lagotis TaxID=92651 RepID=UPI003D680B1F
MESPSEALHCGDSPWKRLLIIASILSCWIQSASAQGAPITIVPNPPFGTVGSDVILDIHGLSGPVFTYTWYRNSIEENNKIAFYHVPSATQNPADIREKVFSNGSMLIPNLALNDTKNYIVLIVDSMTGESKQASVLLSVYELLPKPTINSSNMAPVEKVDNVSLTCLSEGPDVSYLWFINESSPAGDRIVLSPDNETLTIINVTRKDKGFYQCEIQNPVSANRSDPFTLNIIYGPDNLMIVPTEPHYSVGATLNLSCSADSNPTAQFTWLINGIQMMSTSQLYIPNVSLNYTGTYTCNASNSITGLSSTKDINIIISEKLSKPNITTNNKTNSIENDTLVLTCDTEHDGMNILWLFKDQPLSPNERMKLSENNQTLTIKLKREDAGSYHCEIWNPISSNKSDFFNLTVYFGPDNIRFSPSPEKEEIEVELNSDLNLVCHVDSNPEAQYEWKVNDSTTSHLSNSIFIKNATWEDSGRYTCLAKNNITSITVSKDIIIKVVEKKSTEGTDNTSLSGGAIAGIVIGVLAGVAIIGGLIYFLASRKRGSSPL